MRHKKEERYDYSKWYVDLFADELPKKNERSTYLGLLAETSRKVYLSIDEFIKPTLIAGATGNGKTVVAQIIVEEALLKGIPAVVIDPTHQWTGFKEALTDERMLRRYTRFGLSHPRPFATTIAAPSQPLDSQHLMTPGTLTVFAVKHASSRSLVEFASSLMHSLQTVITEPSSTLNLLVVFEEFHRMHLEESSSRGFRVLFGSFDEFSNRGIGIILISHVLSDFGEAMLISSNNHIQMRTTSDADLGLIEKRYGMNRMKSLSHAEVGVGMVYNASFNNGYAVFVEFRPLYHHINGILEEHFPDKNQKRA